MLSNPGKSVKVRTAFRVMYPNMIAFRVMYPRLRISAFVHLHTCGTLKTHLLSHLKMQKSLIFNVNSHLHTCYLATGYIPTPTVHAAVKDAGLIVVVDDWRDRKN